MSRSHTIVRRTSLVLASAVAAVAASFGVASAQSGYGAPGGASPAPAAPASAPSVAGPPAAATRPPVAGAAVKRKIDVNLFAPANGDRVNPTGWFVDLAANYGTGLSRTGFSTPQLTGPAAHANVAPAPGAFGPGHDDKWPGLIVLLSTAKAGSGQNLANLFNLTGVTNRSKGKAQLWSTWLVGAPNFGQNVESRILVAIAADKNGNGVFDDAPDVVPDADGDGIVGTRDLKAFGVASNIERRKFFIGG
jgi:hypothetical protein